MGYQQAQTRRRELTGKLDTVDRTASTPAAARCRASSPRAAARSAPAASRPRGRAEDQVRTTVTRVQGLGTEVAKRVEPVVEQVQTQLGDLPERVVQVIEPVAARVRELTGSAA